MKEGSALLHYDSHRAVVAAQDIGVYGGFLDEREEPVGYQEIINAPSRVFLSCPESV